MSSPECDSPTSVPPPSPRTRQLSFPCRQSSSKIESEKKKGKLAVVAVPKQGVLRRFLNRRAVLRGLAAVLKGCCGGFFEPLSHASAYALTLTHTLTAVYGLLNNELKQKLETTFKTNFLFYFLYMNQGGMCVKHPHLHPPAPPPSPPHPPHLLPSPPLHPPPPPHLLPTSSPHLRRPRARTDECTYHIQRRCVAFLYPAVSYFHSMAGL
jgi:hypothetical protein